MSDLEEKLKSGKLVDLVVTGTKSDDLGTRQLLKELKLHWNSHMQVWHSWGPYPTDKSWGKQELKRIYDKLTAYSSEKKKSLKLHLLYDEDFEKIKFKRYSK